MYRFLNLSSASIATRRQVLDKYGFIAQLSALCLLLLVGLYRWLLPSPIHSRKASMTSLPSSSSAPNDFSNDAVEMTPQSPAARARSPSARGLGGGVNGEESMGLMAEGSVSGDGERSNGDAGVGVGGKEQGLGYTRSRMSVWLDGSIAPGWRETRRQVLSVGLWGAWLGVLVFRETGEDYFHLTKRLAHIPASLLPFHFLLGLSTPSPLPLLLRAPSSASYNAYHRLHGILLLTLIFLHSAFYIGSFIQRDLGWAPFRSRTVLLGLGMVVTLGVVGGMAREGVRRGWRGGFLWTHVGGAGVVLGLLWFHVGAARWYVGEAGVVWGVGVAGRGWRFWRGRKGKGRG